MCYVRVLCGPVIQCDSHMLCACSVWSYDSLC